MNDTLISFYWNESTDFIKLNPEGIYLKSGSKKFQFSYANVISFKLDTKKKLAPLVSGAVLTSLALVNILIEGAGLSMIGFLSIGLLTLYFGLSNYWVFNIEQFSKSTSIWISKNKCAQIPATLVNIIDFKIAKGEFPPFYAYINKVRISKVINYSNTDESLVEPIVYYLIPPKSNPDYILLKIDITKMTTPLEFVLNQLYLAEGSYKINKEALLNIEV